MRDAIDRHAWSDRQSARCHACPPDAETRGTEGAGVVRNIAMTLYARAASPALRRKGMVTARAAYSTRAKLAGSPAFVAAGTPPLVPVRARLRALAVGRLPAKDSLLTRPCLLRGRTLLQRSRAHGPVGALVHFEPAAPARRSASGSLPQQRPTAELRAQVTGAGCNACSRQLSSVPEAAACPLGGAAQRSSPLRLFQTAQRVALFAVMAPWPSAERNPTRSP